MMGKKSRFKNIGSSLKNRVKKAKRDVVLKTKVMRELPKLRWTSSAAASEMIKRLRETSEPYKNLPTESRRQVDNIVFEEASKKVEYKAYELFGLAKRIEKRVKKEVSD